MIFSLAFKDGQAFFRNRFVRTEGFKAEQVGRGLGLTGCGGGMGNGGAELDGGGLETSGQYDVARRQF